MCNDWRRCLSRSSAIGGVVKGKLYVRLSGWQLPERPRACRFNALNDILYLYIPEAPEVSVIGEQPIAVELQGSFKRKKKKRRHTELLEDMETPIEYGRSIVMSLLHFSFKQESS